MTNEKMMKKHVRTINSVYDEIRAEDENTAISRNAIRQAVVNGSIPSVKVGRTYLITVEDAIDYFTGCNGGVES